MGAERGSKACTLTAGALVVASAFLVAGLNAGILTLTSPHEARVLETSREMLERGDWIVPTYNGELRFKKPPLPYWVTMGAYLLAGGPSVEAARLVLAGFAALTVLATIVLGKTLHGARVGILSGVIVGASWLFAGEFRKLTPDPFLAFGTTSTLAALAVALRRPRGQARGPAALAILALALGLLAKGPIALLFIGLGAVGVWPTGVRPRAGPLLLATILALLPLAAWSTAVVARVPEAREVWTRELGQRIPGFGHDEVEADEPTGASATAEERGGDGRGPLLYGRVVLTALLPAAFALILAFIPRAGGSPRLLRALLLGLLVLGAMPSRKDAYFLPLLPWLSVLAASALGRSGVDARTSLRPPRPRLDFAILLLRRGQVALWTLSAALVAGGIVARGERLYWYEGLLAAGLVAVALAVPWLAAWRRDAMLLAALGGMLAMGGFGAVFESRGPQDLSRYQLGRLLAERAGPSEHIFQLGVFEPVVSFYARRTPRVLAAASAPPPDPEVGTWVLVPRRLFASLGVQAVEVGAACGGVRQGKRPRRLPPGEELVLAYLPASR